MRALRKIPISMNLEKINCRIELKDIHRLLYFEDRKNSLSKKSVDQLRAWWKTFCTVANPILTHKITRYSYLEVVFQYLYNTNPTVELIKSFQPKYAYIQSDHPKSVSKLLIAQSKVIDVSIRNNDLNRLLKTHHHKIRDLHIHDTRGQILHTIPPLNIQTLHLSKVHFNAFENNIRIQCSELIISKCILNESFYEHVSIRCKHLTITSTNVKTEEIIPKIKISIIEI